MTEQNTESGPSIVPEVEQSAMIVAQPGKLENLLGKIEEITAVTVEATTEDMQGGTGVQASGGQSDDGARQSPRDRAIANLPTPQKMQKQLTQHIEGEIKKLRKEVRNITWSVNKKGAAHRANQLYAKIRRLNSILSELYETSIEVLKRLYIRVIIDKQPVM